MTTPIKLVFLARSLDYGGAQRQLISLAKALDKKRFHVTVLTFYHGPLAQELNGHGVQVISLDKKGRWDIFGFLLRLVRLLRLARPDVVHAYLDIPHLLSLILKPFVRTRVVWGLRTSTIELDQYDWLHRLASRAEKWCSRFADLIIINSNTGLEQHVARGLPRKKMLVIPNGFDTEVFKPDREAGAKQRSAWRVQEQTQLLGIVGRLDPMKDHQNFFRAAALVSKKMNDVSLTEASAGNRGEVRFVCVGDGPANYLEGLKALAKDLGISERVIWQEATTAVAAVYNALDVLVSSSRAEGLSNAVGEAMACGVACVTTDVGDSRLLVGECGSVVPAQNSEALAEGIIRSLSGKQPELGNVARERIVAHFSVQRLAQLTEEALVSVADSGRS